MGGMGGRRGKSGEIFDSNEGIPDRGNHHFFILGIPRGKKERERERERKKRKKEGFSPPDKIPNFSASATEVSFD